MTYMLLFDCRLRILQATPEQISMDLKNELMYQLDQDHDLQAVSLCSVIGRQCSEHQNFVGAGRRAVNNTSALSGKVDKGSYHTAYLSYHRRVAVASQGHGILS